MFGSTIHGRRPLVAALVAAVLAVAAVSVIAAHGASGRTEASFELAANPKFVNCLAKFPNDPSRPPTASVDVEKGDLNDQLTLHLHNVKPNLAFDLFTVQRSTLDAQGKPISPAPSFGLAWYQSDVQADDHGNGRVKINTILADQIFGVNLDQSPAQPINTFHLGFWFNNPNDAASCGFDVTKPTPFNGEHTAGPLAMISLPDAQTGLGPLCLNPDASQPSGCNP
jgi:hypothetical protein